MLFSKPLPKKHLLRVFNDRAVRAKTPLKTIIKNVKKQNPDLSVFDRRRVARTINKLNNDPRSFVTSKDTKAVVEAMAESGYLKRRYKGNPAKTIRAIKRGFRGGNEGAPFSEKYIENLTGKEKKIAERKRTRHLEDLAAERAQEDLGTSGNGLAGTAQQQPHGVTVLSGKDAKYTALTGPKVSIASQQEELEDEEERAAKEDYLKVLMGDAYRAPNEKIDTSGLIDMDIG